MSFQREEEGDSSAVLRIKDLNKTMGDRQVIQDFSLEVMEGEIMCLLGNNGAGKTTLINLLTGLCQPDPDSGDVTIRTEKGLVSLLSD